VAGPDSRGLAALALADLRPPRLLVVDDNRILLQWIEDVCECATEVEVAATAESAEEALRLLPMTQPDIVVLDAELANAALVIEAARGMAGLKMLLLTGDEPGAAAPVAERNASQLCKDALATGSFLQAIRALGLKHWPSRQRAAAEAARRQRRRLSARTLSKRQQQIIDLVAVGKTNKEIAAVLNISPYTVKQHVSNMLHVLHFQRRAQLAALSHSYSRLQD